MKIRKINSSWQVYLIGIIMVIMMGVKHLYDTEKGAVATGHLWLLRNYGVLFFSVCICLAVIGYLSIIKKIKSIETVFLICSISLGISYCFVLAPLSAPDEISHYISSYKLSNQLMGKPAVEEHGLVYIRAEDYFIEDIEGQRLTPEGEETKESITLGQLLNQQTYAMIHEKLLETNIKEGTVVSNEWVVRTTPLAYAPQAVGITLARVLGLNSIWLLYLGRLFNLIFYVVVVWLAMKRLPFGKEILFGISLFPMTLHLSGSMSYDVMIMAMSFYLTATCIDLTYAKERVTVGDIATLAIVVAILSPCKIVYAVMLGFCLLIPPRKFGNGKRYLVSASCVLTAFLISMILVNRQTVAVYMTETESYVAWAEQAGYSFAYLIHNPQVVLQLLYETLIWQGESYHLNMVGNSLGNIDPVLNVPYLIVVGLSIALILLTLRKPGDNLMITTKQKLWIWFICAAGGGAILFSMLLAWTPVNSSVILGVQGRYFLPFLLMFMLSIKNDWIVLTKAADRSILYGMCCINGYLLLRLFSIVSMRL